ncbi:MAG: CRISPR-associated helicase Cas3' [Thermoguttaceae bacterium]|jgi:CRISPR-associated endonuclease/helicase Cas3
MKVEFWAKTTPDDKPGISVSAHMANVGCVARCLAEIAPNLLNRFQIGAAEAGALAALHDLGKISPGFQQKCAAWLERNRLREIAQRWTWDTAMEPDHGKVSHAAVQDFLVRNGTDRRTAKFLSAALGGHHGRLNPPSDRGFKPGKQISEQHAGIDWDLERRDAASAVCEAFGVSLAQLAVDNESPALWWLAGLTSVADWIGSDVTFFPADSVVLQTDAAAIARRAVAAIGFDAPEVTPGLSFHDLFHDEQRPEVQFTPNEMQLRAISTITAPGVYVIEAPMGTGKTEAALGAAYQLLAGKKARGIYFALPTQATSNRMQRRMAEFVRRIAPSTVGSRIIHGNSWLLEQELRFSPAASGKQNAVDDARLGRDWFASAKRTLLAPFGVGTVDQALLGVVAAKHFFVRHYALAGKVVILDEIHSYDIYTGTLIDKLISALEGLGCTVIVLSATLTGKRRGQIVRSGDEEDHGESLPYPLITGRRENEPIPAVPATPPPARDVGVVFEATEDAVDEAVALAENGGCVLWVCDTVGAAQEQYQRFRAVAGERYRLGLLHSRFPFWRRQELEDEWMERLGKSGATRCASILVSTQVVEQSVDLDADLLISELAPTDMLLQRTGRLWRHERGRPASALSPRLIVLDETASLDDFRRMNKTSIVKALGAKAYVYAPYVLLRSLEVWKERKSVALPDQIRTLIEATYAGRDDEPQPWRDLFDEWFATDSCKKIFAARNSNLWTVALEDDEGVQTRLNELPTLSLVLCRWLSKTDAEFIDGSRAVLGGDEFRLATAKAIHRNLVKVPARHFLQVKEHPGIARYLRGAQRVGVVDHDGTVMVEGLQNGGRLCWSSDLGIIIENTSGEEKG